MKAQQVFFVLVALLAFSSQIEAKPGFFEKIGGFVSGIVGKVTGSKDKGKHEEGTVVSNPKTGSSDKEPVVPGFGSSSSHNDFGGNFGGNFGGSFGANGESNSYSHGQGHSSEKHGASNGENYGSADSWNPKEGPAYPSNQHYGNENSYGEQHGHNRDSRDRKYHGN